MLHHAWWTLSPKKSVDPDRVCTTLPIQVQSNASFIVDMGVVKNPLDLRADNNGTWVHNGPRTIWLSMNKKGFVGR